METTPFEYWSAKRVQQMTAYSRVTLWRKARDADDDFPAPFKLSAGRTAWRSDQVIEWMQSREPVPYAAAQANAEAA